MLRLSVPQETESQSKQRYIWSIKNHSLTEVETISDRCGNDPSAGSPTETLLRLHLPLNDEV